MFVIQEVQNYFFHPARKYLLPVKDKFDLVKNNHEVLPGIKLITKSGHTPGLMVIDINSRDKRLFVSGI
jgi:glyoxylase-like metal-dependent hydrolase (beta-lactamase superfamily II)